MKDEMLSREERNALHQRWYAAWIKLPPELAAQLADVSKAALDKGTPLPMHEQLSWMMDRGYGN